MHNLKTPLFSTLFLFQIQFSLTQTIQIQSFTINPCFQDSIVGACATFSINIKNCSKGLYRLFLRFRLTSLTGTVIQTPDTFTALSSFYDGQIWQLEDTLTVELLSSITEIPFQKRHSIFIPYYSLKLESGTHTLRCNLHRIQIEKWDTLSQHFIPIPYTVSGETEFTFPVTLSPFVQARVCLDTVEVAPYDHSYNNWDESLFLPSETLPDIQVLIVASNDIRFHFPDTPNTYITTYHQTCSPWIYWRSQDKIKVQICDKDISGCHEVGTLFLPLIQTDWTVYQDTFLKFFKYKLEIRKE